MSGPLPGILLLLAAAVAAGLVYAGLCWLRPFRKCLVCGGTGRKLRVAACFWCRGVGVRLRIGRRVYNRFARLRAGDQLTLSRRLGLKE